MRILHTITCSQWSEPFRTNWRSTRHLTRDYALTKAGAERIVNAPDWRGVRPNPKIVVTAIEKVGMK